MPEAIGEFRKALALDENSKETQLSVARILYRSQQTRKAAAELEKLVKNSPEFIQGRIWLGICYHKLGRIEDAQTQWARANATDPTDVEGKAYLNIATNLDVKGFIRAT